MADNNVLYVAGSICKHLDCALDQSRVMAAAHAIAEHFAAQGQDAEPVAYRYWQATPEGGGYYVLIAEEGHSNCEPLYAHPPSAQADHFPGATKMVEGQHVGDINVADIGQAADSQGKSVSGADGLPARCDLNTIREALEGARNGLRWYRENYPDADSQADDEQDALIETALDLIKPQPSGNAPLADIRELAGYAEGSKSPRMVRASRAAFAWLDGKQPSGNAGEVPAAVVSQETFNDDGTSDIITPALPIGTKLYTALQPSRNAEELPSDWKSAVQAAYGHLWRVNNEPGTPNRYSPARAAYEARKLLRDLLTKEERGDGINAAMSDAQQLSGNLGQLDERAAFEQWYFQYEEKACEEFGGLDTTNPKGIAEDAWEARAALAAQPSGQDREDAERWRFARDILSADSIANAAERMLDCVPDPEESRRTDAAIDAARAAAKGQ